MKNFKSILTQIKTTISGRVQRLVILTWLKKAGKLFCLTNNIYYNFFRGRKLSVGKVFGTFFYCILVANSCFAEAPFAKKEINSNTFNVDINRDNVPIVDRLNQGEVNITGKFIEFFSFIKAKFEAMPEKKTTKEEKYSNYIFGVHWAECLLWLVFGLWCGGAFDRTPTKLKKYNLLLGGINS